MRKSQFGQDGVTEWRGPEKRKGMQAEGTACVKVQKCAHEGKMIGQF